MGYRAINRARKAATRDKEGTKGILSIGPRPSLPLISFIRTISGLYVRFALRFVSVELAGGSRAVEAFRDFQQGRTRLIIAFRHPYGDEPQLLAYAIGRLIPREARKSGKPLPAKPHAHFVHGYEVPLWMGPVVGWLLARGGAVPVHHVKLDSEGMARIRRIMTDGPFPLALAPEGQVSYSSRTVPRLESGFARIASWCAADLRAAGRTERVIILPVSFHHSYGKQAGEILERTLRMIEEACGLEAAAVDTDGKAFPQRAFARLGRAAQAITAIAEEFYAGTESIDTRSTRGEATPEAPEPTLNERFRAVVEASLRAGERSLGLKAEGDITRRFYLIRQAGWDRIYRQEPGAKGAETSSPLVRALADRAAGEGWYAMRHMELADIGYYIDFQALREDEPIERYIETAQNYWDLTSRLRGGNISDRLNFAPKKATLVFGAPIDCTGRPEEAAGRKGAREALTKELETNYLECIARYEKEYRNVDR